MTEGIGAVSSPISTEVHSGAWREASVVSVRRVGSHAAILRMDVPDRIPHLAGQHYVIRLSAEDGYVAQRSYSVASAPSDPQLEFYIDRLPDGEVSTFLTDAVEVGDTLDLRGPIGGWFVWDGSSSLLGVAGGSGVVPFVSMLRHARDIGRTDSLALAVSARALAELPYAEELSAAGAMIALTRERVEGTKTGRLTGADLAPLLVDEQFCYVCGSATFSGAATAWLRELGVPDSAVRVESFGPTN